MFDVINASSLNVQLIRDSRESILRALSFGRIITVCLQNMFYVFSEQINVFRYTSTTVYGIARFGNERFGKFDSSVQAEYIGKKKLLKPPIRGRCNTYMYK